MELKVYTLKTRDWVFSQTALAKVVRKHFKKDMNHKLDLRNERDFTLEEKKELEEFYKEYARESELYEDICVGDCDDEVDLSVFEDENSYAEKSSL
jgi:hypothetical protein